MLATTGKWVDSLARNVALLGGAVLVLIAGITFVSVVGRALLPFGFKPLRGQFELVEAGTVFVVCAFLPWCHLSRGHASVAIFTDRMGRLANALIDLLSDILLLAVSLVITWRLIAGMIDKITYGETTFLLGFPLWWSYAGALVGLFSWIIVALWSSANSARQCLAPPLAGSPGAGAKT